MNNETLRTCLVCNHRAVCGMYEELYQATVKIRVYEELERGYEEELYKVLAQNCCRYDEEC